MKETDEKPTGLPENAFRPLKPGEQYHPLMSPDKNYPEVNAWSVTVGHCHGNTLLGSSGILGVESGAGIRSRHPHRHHCRGSVWSRQA